MGTQEEVGVAQERKLQQASLLGESLNPRRHGNHLLVSEGDVSPETMGHFWAKGPHR